MSGLGQTVRIGSHLDSLSAEIFQARIAAHAKHGENSIERIGAWDTGTWLAVLGEEYGEVCRALTYDSDGDLRSELLDLVTAWIHALDQVPDINETPDSIPPRPCSCDHTSRLHGFCQAHTEPARPGSCDCPKVDA